MEDHKAIWVVSYPKSGNTWVRTLLRNYIELKYGNPPMESSDAVPYFYHTVSPFPLADLKMEHLVQLRPAAMMHTVALHHSRMHPAPATLLKSHMVSHAAHGIAFHSPLWMDRVIYVYRDPRDILPSYADHLGKTHEETVELLGRETATIGSYPKIPSITSSWSNNVQSWMGDGAQECLMVSYEELSDNPRSALKRMVKYCGFELDSGCIMDAAARSSFHRLQQQEAKAGFTERTVHQERFFRRGVVGSHKDEVDPKHIARIEDDHRGAMTALGYLP